MVQRGWRERSELRGAAIKGKAGGRAGGRAGRPGSIRGAEHAQLQEDIALERPQLPDAEPTAEVLLAHGRVALLQLHRVHLREALHFLLLLELRVVRRHLWRDSGRERPRAHGHRAAAPEAADQPLQRLAASRHHQVQARGRAAGVPKEDRSTSCPHQILGRGRRDAAAAGGGNTVCLQPSCMCRLFSLFFEFI